MTELDRAASFVGLAGVVAVTGGIYLLAGIAWAIIVFGVFLLITAATNYGREK